MDSALRHLKEGVSKDEAGRLEEVFERLGEVEIK